MERRRHSLQKWSWSTGERQQLFKVWLYSNYKEMFTFSNREDQSGLWGMKVFLLKKKKKVSILYFLSSSLGKSSDVDAMEGSRWRNLSRMMTKMFSPFMVLTLMKIIFVCAMLQTHCLLSSFRNFPDFFREYYLRRFIRDDQMNPCTLKRILKCVRFVGQWWATFHATQ